MCDSNEGVWRIMSTTVWECGICGKLSHINSKNCEHCGTPYGVKGVPEALTIEVETTAIVTTDTVIESIHIQLRDLANDNRDGKFIVLSEEIYWRLKVEMENYHMYAMFPTECLDMTIIIDIHAEPTMLRVLPGLIDIVGMP